MKNIIPALNKLQLSCQDRAAPLSAIGLARQELFAAIREALVQGFTETQHPAPLGVRDAYLAKFDKLHQ